MDAGIHITRGTSLRLAPYDQAGITALAAERVAAEILAGIAASRRGG